MIIEVNVVRNVLIIEGIETIQTNGAFIYPKAF